MKIATLQFAPNLGDIEGNIKRANEILQHGKLLGDGPLISDGLETLKPDLLVLPELALTGYNFPSLEAIKPYVEAAGQGPCGTWARQTAQKYHCKVCVGYPEIEQTTESDAGPCYYNSLLVVDQKGEVVLNYRKTFLYYTDETWATEGDAGRSFHSLAVKETAAVVPTSFGICMDINPYKFEAPFTAWEFAHRVLESKSRLVVLSMAWLTLLSREELDALADKPDMNTFNYWVQRFWPLVKKRMDYGEEGGLEGGDEEEGGKQVVIVFANRAGEEDGHPLARYAGTSAIIAIKQRSLPHSASGEASSEEGEPFDVKILCWDMMGAGSEAICFADTTDDPKMVFGLVKSSD
ncbi:Carbon-nitrogen hydrolase [Aspergillus nanangensis]|uniref:Carbon-nitrogen hydrolase n=1 Tax=Aspergillus nanangensis TaxID=2582783 RepID=A0AAD4GZV8_ASPNN|nr:Carbon-nitrogen hydrolase [Aspergillus nanangensis]